MRRLLIIALAVVSFAALATPAMAHRHDWHDHGHGYGHYQPRTVIIREHPRPCPERVVVYREAPRYEERYIVRERYVEPRYYPGNTFHISVGADIIR